MNYPELSKFDPETQQLIIGYVEKANVGGLKSTLDFEKTFVSIAEDLENKKISIDDFSFLCGKLLLILEENDSIQGEKLEEFLLMGDDSEWYIKHNPQKGSEIIDSVLAYAKELKEKRIAKP